MKNQPKLKSNSKDQIFLTARHLFALSGYDGMSMRHLAQEAGISLSAIYNHYPDKDLLLEEIFNKTNTELGRLRAKLPIATTMDQALRQILEFQFKHIEEVVFVLKYFLHFRKRYAKSNNGFVPPKTSLHIEEVMLIGKATGELRTGTDIPEEAKLICHAINGFLLEYYPTPPKGQQLNQLVGQLHEFIYRSTSQPTGGEVVMS